MSRQKESHSQVFLATWKKADGSNSYIQVWAWAFYCSFPSAIDTTTFIFSPGAAAPRGGAHSLTLMKLSNRFTEGLQVSMAGPCKLQITHSNSKESGAALTKIYVLTEHVLYLKGCFGRQYVPRRSNQKCIEAFLFMSQSSSACRAPLARITRLVLLAFWQQTLGNALVSCYWCCCVSLVSTAVNVLLPWPTSSLSAKRCRD